MDLTFNVLESIRRDIRELRDDLHIEKTSRHKQFGELQLEVKNITRDVRYLRQEVVAEHEARETSIENLRREMTEELRREVGAVRGDIDSQRKRIRVQEEEGFMTIDGTCISWGASDIAPGGAPAATDIDFPRKYRTPPAVFSGSRDHCSFVIGTGDNGHSRVLKDGFTASALSFAGVEATRKGCQMNWMAIGARVVDAERAEGTQASFAGRAPRLEQMSQQELDTYLRTIFRQADADGNGYLDSKEFMNLLQNSQLQLSRSAIRRIMEEADLDHNGKIEYREYAPVIIDIIETTNQIQDALVDNEELELQCWEAAQNMVLGGMQRKDLEQAAKGIFEAYDIDGSGALDRQEFAECLRSLDMGLTKKEIQYTMAHIDVNGDGKVDYAEFLPLWIDIVITVIKDKLLEEPSGKANEALFTQMFEEADPTHSGKVHQADMRKILGKVIGMTPVQVETVMSEAQIGGDGKIIYGKFSRVCAQYYQAYCGTAPPVAKDPADMTDQELEGFLQATFTTADADQSGALDEHEFLNLLKGSGLGLTRRAISDIMEAADDNEDGLIQYGEFVPMMIEIFQSQALTKAAQETLEIEEARASQAAQEMIMLDMSAEQLEQILQDMFQTADEHNLGWLSRNQFFKVLKSVDVGLTNKEMRLVMADVDRNADGKISYEEFIPLAKDILVEVMKDKLLKGSSKLAVLMEFFNEKFREIDAKETGFVTPDEAMYVLTDVGMSTTEAELLLREAKVDGQGRIQYSRFARICASMALNTGGGRQGPTVLKIEKRRARAKALFRRVDTDNSGALDIGELETFVTRLAAKFRQYMDPDALQASLARFAAAPLTEDAWADYVCREYADVDDEIFFAFLDFVDTPSYTARVGRLRSLFWQLDTDGSGFVEMDEHRSYLKKMDAKLDGSLNDNIITQASIAFSHVDVNGDGKISEEEFITAYLELFETVTDQEFFAGLDLFDVRIEGTD